MNMIFDNGGSSIVMIAELPEGSPASTIGANVEGMSILMSMILILVAPWSIFSFHLFVHVSPDVLEGVQGKFDRIFVQFL